MNREIKLIHILQMILLTGIVGLFFALDSASSLLSWLLCLGILRFIISFLEKRFVDVSHFKSLVLTSYFILSFVGLIICVDNVNNFGVPFGTGHDDSEFFQTIVATSENRDVEHESWLFEYLHAGYGKLYSLLSFSNDFSLLDLLPLNWLIAALCVGLAGQIVYQLTQKEVPVWLLLVSLNGNFLFVNNTVRLYRDVLMVVFVLITVIQVLKRQSFKPFCSAFIVLMLRGGNGLLTFLYMGMQKITCRLKPKNVKKFYFILIIISFLISGSSNLNQQGSLMLAMMTKMENSVRYFHSFQGMEFSKIVERRYEKKFGQERGKMASIAYNDGGLMGSGIRLSLFMFFPITFHSPFMSIEHNSVYGDVGYVDRGFFILNVVKWFMILIWIAVVPLLLIGLFRAMKGTLATKNLAVLYIISLVLITFVSIQIRHSLYYIAFNPVFCGIGYFAIQENHKTRELYKFGMILVGLGLLVFNFLR